MLRIKNIKINILKNQEEELSNYIKKKLYTKIDDYIIRKRSIDARYKPDLYFIYDIDVIINNESKYINNKDIIKSPFKEYELPKMGNTTLSNRIVIVGSGPSSLFNAYILAKTGYKPLIIERGKDIEERIKDVNELFDKNILNPNSNVQYGLGGAGTFSDGKLNTLTKDPRNYEVFRIFVENGADTSILYDFHPHIGTDKLRMIISNMKDKIIKWGGEFRFNTTLTNININNNELVSIEVNNNEIIETNVLILGIGHSAKDTTNMLRDKGLNMSLKGFAVGVRIEHKEEMISYNQYGPNYKLLEPASYKLTYNTKDGKGVYTFCMCPGGYVVNSSSDEGHMVINGMSNSKRDGVNSNSAVIVSLPPNKFDNDINKAFIFQEELEIKAYNEGNGYIPNQLYKDFKNNIKSENYLSISPCTMGKSKLSNLRNIFSDDISNSLIEGIENFGTKIKGFNMDDAILSAVESRTSSIIRMERDDNMESNIKGIYPIGEGSGHAGGITTSAVDGIKCAEEIIKKYKS